MTGELLSAASPLMLAGLGALLSDLSGALGIFIEGFMNLGAFFSWIIAGWTGSAFWGTLASAVLAGLGGWALARFVRITGANPFIAGLAFNIMAGGITNSLSALWFGTKGVLRNADLAVPDRLPFTVSAWGFTVLAAIFIQRTAPGLRLRASGLSPEAAAERGIAPERYRELAWAAASFLAAMSGAALTFRVGVYAPGGIAGRGWIALAAVYLGFRRVWGVALAALAFTLAERLGYGVQRFGALPPTALLGLPSALALVFYTLSRAVNITEIAGRLKKRRGRKEA
jgi:simple sugar transport system permease protein